MPPDPPLSTHTGPRLPERPRLVLRNDPNYHLIEQALLHQSHGDRVDRIMAVTDYGGRVTYVGDCFRHERPWDTQLNYLRGHVNMRYPWLPLGRTEVTEAEVKRRGRWVEPRHD